ncbi:hypothetical protein Tco_1421316, partial [Tanacetum coccineum]
IVKMKAEALKEQNTRFWSKKDVDRSKDFIFAIQKRLKTRLGLLKRTE